ncbi:MAG TPA: CopD family protein [Caulobacteraceae bacterium]|nr:CopD family protein [Caulobacteraceae bacterium]
MKHLVFYHNLLIALHIIAVIAWLAGLLYLPRLFAYHTRAEPGSQMDETFKIMELKLYRIIMNSGMVAVWALGLTLIWFDATRMAWGWGFLLTPWMLTKLAGVLFLTWWHHYLGRARKGLAAGRRDRSERFWRMTNELPFLAAIVMIIAITTKFAF